MLVLRDHIIPCAQRLKEDFKECEAFKLRVPQADGSFVECPFWDFDKIDEQVSWVRKK